MDVTIQGTQMHPVHQLLFVYLRVKHCWSYERYSLAILQWPVDRTVRSRCIHQDVTFGYIGIRSQLMQRTHVMWYI